MRGSGGEKGKSGYRRIAEKRCERKRGILGYKRKKKWKVE